MNVELQPLDSLSKETLVDLIHSIFPESDSHWDIQKEVEQSLKDTVDQMSAIAWENDEPVGAIICVDRNGVQLDHLGVLPNHQRMGIGRMLLRHAVDNTEENMVARIPKDNQPIRELIEEEGFEEIEEKEGHHLYEYNIE